MTLFDMFRGRPVGKGAVMSEAALVAIVGTAIVAFMMGRAGFTSFARGAASSVWVIAAIHIYSRIWDQRAD